MKKRLVLIRILICFFIIGLFTFVIYLSFSGNKKSDENSYVATNSLEDTTQSEELSVLESAEEDKVTIENETLSKTPIGVSTCFEFDKDYEISLIDEKICTVNINKIDETNALIKINEKELKVQTEGELLDYYHIVDVDVEDDFYEIELPTSTKESIWIRFNATYINNIGSLNGIIGDGLYFYENGEITLYEKTNVLETNFIPMIYKIESNKFVKCEQDIYEFSITNIRENSLQNKEDLIVRTLMDKDSEKFTIPSNSTLEITKTDNKEWVNLLFEENEYWLRVIDLKLIDNDKKEAKDVFENLIMY